MEFGYIGVCGILMDIGNGFYRKLLLFFDCCIVFKIVNNGK